MDDCYKFKVNPDLVWDENEDKDEPVNPFEFSIFKKSIKSIHRNNEELN